MVDIISHLILSIVLNREEDPGHLVRLDTYLVSQVNQGNSVHSLAFLGLTGEHVLEEFVILSQFFKRMFMESQANRTG